MQLGVIIGSLLLGISKAGIKGPGVAIVGLFALAFGAKASTGILLPLLIFADIIAVIYYRRNVDLELLLKLMPAMVVGVLLGTWIGAQIDDGVFKVWMAIIILCGLIIMVVRDLKWKNTIPKGKLFGWVMGLAAGFTTMVGNLAGPFANLYFMAYNTSKVVFIGTAAWAFFIINLFKVPFHVWVWNTIDQDTLLIDFKYGVFVLIGFILGAYLVRLISELWYRYIIYGATGLGALLILVS